MYRERFPPKSNLGNGAASPCVETPEHSTDSVDSVNDSLVGITFFSPQAVSASLSWLSTKRCDTARQILNVAPSKAISRPFYWVVGYYFKCGNDAAIS